MTAMTVFIILTSSCDHGWMTPIHISTPHV
jgi:hypothetical protein